MSGRERFRFARSLREGTTIRRPNRFIMVIRADGRTLRCHCPTTGRLGELKLSGLPCLYSQSESARRKTHHTVEAISLDPPSKPVKRWIGINQVAANRYVEHFLRNGVLSGMATGEVRREVPLGQSRIDFLVGGTYVEVKTPLTTLAAEGREDSTRRSRFNSFDRLIKHMSELRESLASGKRAVMAMCYLYDAKPFSPPAEDRANSRILSAARLAERSGVENWQVNMRIDENGVSVVRYFKNSFFARPSSHLGKAGEKEG